MSSFNWVQKQRQSRFVVGDESKEPEVAAFLSLLGTSHYVITGAGGRIKDSNFKRISLQVKPINDDGTLGPPINVTFGDDNTDNEQWITLDDDQVCVGMGMRCSDDNLANLRLYYREWNSDLGTLSTEVNHVNSDTDDTHCEQKWYIEKSDFSEDELYTTILTGVAATASSDDISMMAFQIGQIEYTFPASELPGEEAEKRQIATEEADDRYDSELMPLAWEYINFANQAYLSAYSDDVFREPIAMLNGTPTTYSSRSNWLNENNFTLIEDPNYNGDDYHQKYWGVVGEFFYTNPETDERETALVVAFRGTDNLNDLAVDLQGVGLGFQPLPLSISCMLNTRTAFWATHWDVGGRNCVVHSGFYDTYMKVQSQVRSIVQQQLASGTYNKLVITGHSLGGALADLCAVDMTANSITDLVPDVYTYGAPRVGDSNFVDLYNNNIGISCAVSHMFDLVPYVPWWYDDESSYPIIDESGNFGNVKGQQVFNRFKFFPYGHMMTAYYNTLLSVVPTNAVSTTLQPSEPVTKVELKITTSDDLWAGTDDEVNFAIGSMGGGSISASSSDFERATVDIFDVTSQMNENLFVRDFYDKTVSFWLSHGIYNNDWKLASVEVYLNGTYLTRLVYNKWVNGGLPSGVTATIPYQGGL